MAKDVPYTIEKVLLKSKISDELPKGTISAKHQIKKLEQFVRFAVYCYFPWWATAPVSLSAPCNNNNNNAKLSIPPKSS